jgi:predicted GNAT family acetyltransferase
MDFIYETNRVYTQKADGKVLSEVLFPSVDSNAVNITKTFVDEELRGQGAADKLLNAAYDYIKSKGLKAELTCSYAVKWFEKNPSKRDILR